MPREKWSNFVLVWFSKFHKFACTIWALEEKTSSYKRLGEYVPPVFLVVLKTSICPKRLKKPAKYISSTHSSWRAASWVALPVETDIASLRCPGWARKFCCLLPRKTVCCQSLTLRVIFKDVPLCLKYNQPVIGSSSCENSKLYLLYSSGFIIAYTVE